MAMETLLAGYDEQDEDEVSRVCNSPLLKYMDNDVRCKTSAFSHSLIHTYTKDLHGSLHCILVVIFSDSNARLYIFMNVPNLIHTPKRSAPYTVLCIT